MTFKNSESEFVVYGLRALFSLIKVPSCCHHKDRAQDSRTMIWIMNTSWTWRPTDNMSVFSKVKVAVEFLNRRHHRLGLWEIFLWDRVI